MSPRCLSTAPCCLTESTGCPGPPRSRLSLGACRGTHLHAVVVGALAVQVAAVVVHAAVVQGAEAHEAVLQGVIALLVHVVMPNHILLTGESLQRHRHGL